MSTTTVERYHLEIIDGVEREKRTPKRLQAILQRRIHSETFTEIDVRCQADRLTPDVSVMVDATYDNGVVYIRHDACG